MSPDNLIGHLVGAVVRFRPHPICGFGNNCYLCGVAIGNESLEPAPGREIWGGFSIKNGLNRENVGKNPTRKTPNC